MNAAQLTLVFWAWTLAMLLPVALAAVYSLMAGRK